MNKIIFSAILTKNQSYSSYSLRTLGNLSNTVKYAYFCTGKDKVEATGDDRKKTKQIPKITLIDQDKMSVLTMEQARKIADKRGLKLVNIVDYDSKSSRPIYKMLTSHEYHLEDLKRREEKKSSKTQQIKPEKLLSIGSKISEHDLQNSINKCGKWITKLHEVRVVISCDDGDMKKGEAISSNIEKEMKTLEGRVLQKRSKGNEIRFTIMPTIKKPEIKGSTESEDKKLLEPTNTIVQQSQQQQSSHSPIAFSEGMCTKCKDGDDKIMKRVKLATYITIFLFAKYSFWSFLYRRYVATSDKLKKCD